jgi:protein-tyrosine-phosphatase
MPRPTQLVFVCSGNICRSPMAEVMSEAIGDQLGLAVRARSGGTLGLLDRPAAANAVQVCREIGVDLSGHRSQGISDELLGWADHVLVMELAHATHLREHFPSVGDKVLLLGPFAGMPEIPDPVGGWPWRFRRTRTQLDTALRALFRRLGSR